MAKMAAVSTVAFLAFGLLTSCGGSSAPKTQDLTIHVINPYPACGKGTSTSTNMVLKDAEAKIVATGKMGKTSSPYNSTVCDLTLNLDKVPVSSFYSVESDSGTKYVTINQSEIQNGVIRIIDGNPIRIGTCEEASKDGTLHYLKPDGGLC